MTHAMVAELTVDELKALIREVVAETLWDELRDPDAGLELQESFREELVDALKKQIGGAPTRPASDVAARLGLRW